MQYLVNLHGGPGVGKSTQARMLEERDGFVSISTGDIIRECTPGFETNSVEGNRFREQYQGALAPFVDLPKTGKHIPNEVILPVLFQEIAFGLESRVRGIVLAGSIKSRSQAEILHELLRHSEMPEIRYKAINYIAEDAILRSRLIARMGFEKRPDEDNLSDQIKNFHLHNEDLVSFYRDEGVLVEIPAGGGISPEYVYLETRKALGISSDYKEGESFMTGERMGYQSRR